jgi:serine/threonine-protein kinase
VPLQDLSGDALLASVSRTSYAGQNVPTLGGIPLLAKLGQGGMGAVYLGVKQMLQQEVAVKVLPLHLAQEQPQLVERFLREARIAARVQSPCLVRVTDVSQEGGLFFLIMEFVAGLSAGSLLKKTAAASQKIDEASALDICIAATQGLAAAHVEGVIHRDIKPDNILIPKAKANEALLFDAAKLADLGLARDETLGQSLTGGQQALGTPGFMAPEQAVDARKAAKPADVFSVGATLYALLAGQSPFKAESSMATILRTIQDPAKPIRDLRPEISIATAELIERCLRKDPAARYVDASALLQGLKTCRSVLGGPDSAQSEALQTIANLHTAREVGAAYNPTPTPVAAPASAPAGRVSGGSTGRFKVLIVLLLAALGGAAFWYWNTTRSHDITIGVLSGPEKEKWMKWAAAEFAKAPEGRGIHINLQFKRTEDAENVLLEGERTINAWAAASDLREKEFLEKWETKFKHRPIAHKRSIAMVPMVFVVWQDRYEALTQRYKQITFDAIGQAMKEKNGWEGIAQKPDWGPFLFGQSDGARSNSGTMSLLLMASNFAKQDKGLTEDLVNAPQFLAWAGDIWSATRVANSSEEMMRDMIISGPAKYDIVFTYESLAIQFLKDAEARLQPLKVAYPPCNIWNEHPFYVLNAPWCSLDQQRAAKAFLDFLLTPAAQKQALLLGFRPATVDVPILAPDSPFVLQAKSGLKADVPVVCEPPKREVIEALIENWKNARK